MKLSLGISVNSDLTKDLLKKREKTENKLHVWTCSQKNMHLCAERNVTHSDMTSEGKLRGMSPVLSHSALSLVHIQEEGQRGGLAFLLSPSRTTQASSSKVSQGDLLRILPECSIPANRCGHGEQPNTGAGLCALVPPLLLLLEEWLLLFVLV